jgi:hypothetical protein
MSRPARSLFVFGVYVLVTGAAFVAMPGLLMSLLQLPPATLAWGRMIGLLALVIGAYDVIAAKAECMPYIRGSVPVRFGFATGTALLVAFGGMPATLLALGATDIAGALWTAMSLKSGTPAVATAT